MENHQKQMVQMVGKNMQIKLYLNIDQLREIIRCMQTVDDSFGTGCPDYDLLKKLIIIEEFYTESMENNP